MESRSPRGSSLHLQPPIPNVAQKHNLKATDTVLPLNFFFFFWAMPHVLWDINTPTRDWTRPWQWKRHVLTTGSSGNSCPSTSEMWKVKVRKVRGLPQSCNHMGTELKQKRIQQLSDGQSGSLFTTEHYLLDWHTKKMRRKVKHVWEECASS